MAVGRDSILLPISRTVTLGRPGQKFLGASGVRIGGITGMLGILLPRWLWVCLLRWIIQYCAPYGVLVPKISGRGSQFL